MSTNPSTGSSETMKYAHATSGPGAPALRRSTQRSAVAAASSASGRKDRMARSVHFPPRVDRVQTHRQQYLVEVEPRDPAGGGDARGRALRPRPPPARWHCATGTTPSPIPAPATTRRTGPSGAGPRVATFPRRHHASRSRTTGSITTEVFASSASRNRPTRVNSAERLSSCASSPRGESELRLPDCRS